LEHAHPTHMHTRIHARTHTGVKVWVASSVCTYFDVRWEKSGRQVYAIAERKAKSSSYTLWKVCFLCVYKETNKTSVVCMYVPMYVCAGGVGC